MTTEQREEIIQLCKTHIDEQGSVRVGWAAEKILKIKPQHNILDKITAKMLETREYIKEPANPNFKYDWNIRKNPEYGKETWTVKNPIAFEIIKGLITALFSIIVSVTLSLLIINHSDNSKQNGENNTPMNRMEKDSISLHI